MPRISRTFVLSLAPLLVAGLWGLGQVQVRRIDSAQLRRGSSTPAEARTGRSVARRVAGNPARARAGQGCGDSDPFAGPLTYSFGSVTYRSPDQLGSESFLAGSAPTLPSFLPHSGSASVWQGWIYSWGDFHGSVDYGKSQDSFEVRAIANGRVIFSDWHAWHGNVVIIEHGAGTSRPYRSMYFHLRDGRSHDLQRAKQTRPSDWSSSDSRDKARRYRKYAQQEFGGSAHWGTNGQTIRVNVGDSVRAGQQIAWAGNTGVGGASAMLDNDGKPDGENKTNIHLHFMISRRAPDSDWYFVDPYGAYSKSTDCYKSLGEGSYAGYFAPVYPSFHNASASLFQDAVDYYSRMNRAPVDIAFHRRGSGLRASGVFRPADEKVRVHHGMTAAQYDQRWEQYRKEGLRPHKHAVYRKGRGQLRFAAIWRPAREGWYSYRALTPDEFNAKIKQMAADGFRLADFASYVSSNNVRVAAIWVKDPKSHYVYWGMDSPTFNKRFNELTAQGYRLTHFDVYKRGNRHRFGGIWTRGIGGQWAMQYGLSGGDFQKAFDSWSGKGFRLMEVRGYNDSKTFSGIWVKGVNGEPQLN